MKYAKNNKEALFGYLCFFIISMGIILRIYAYINARGLWLDEGFLYCSLREFTLSELYTQPLLYMQNAPFGFLFLTKLITDVFGINEWSLRFVSLLSGCAIPVTAYALIRKRFDKFTIFATLLLLAFFPSMIFYSNEFKQYSLETFLALLLIYLGLNVRSKKAIFFAGLISLLFSSTITFVLAGVGVGLFIRELRTFGFYKALLHTAPIGLGWLCFFALYYFSFLAHNSHPQFYVFWNDWFVQPSFSWALDRKEDVARFLGISRMQNVCFIFGGGVFILGAYVLAKKERILAIILSAMFFALISASAFHMYPVHLRLVLFTFPYVFLILCLGLSWIIGKIHFVLIFGEKQFARLIVAAFIFVLAASSWFALTRVETSNSSVSAQKGFKYIIPAIEEEFSKKNAKIYIDTSWPVFKFYTELRRSFMPFLKLPVNNAKASETYIAKEIEDFSGDGIKKVILVFYKDEQSGVAAKSRLQKYGAIYKEFHTSDTNIYFFDMSD